MKQSILLMVFLTTIVFTHAQKPFYGTVDYKFTVEGVNADMMSFMMPGKMVVQYGKKGMKMYFEGGSMAALMGKIVLNGKTNEIFQVRDDEQVVYMMGPEDLGGTEIAMPDSVVMEEEKVDIAGYSCQKYKTLSYAEDGAESVQYIWTTSALAAPEVSTPELQAKAGMNLGANGVPGFPMKSVTTEPSSGMTITLEATKLDFTKVKGKEFGVPKGYEVAEFEMGVGE